MNRIDRLLIGALVLGVWALVAMQFFGGMTASAAQYATVEVLNWPYSQTVRVDRMPYETDRQGGPTLYVYCTNCN